MIDKILEIILELLPFINPSAIDKIEKEIERIKEARLAKEKEFFDALEKMDVDVLNRLFSELFGRL
jgi:hypothetical protein